MTSSRPIILEITCKATAEKVWQAITDAEQMKQWYFNIDDFKMEVGHVFTFYEPGGTNRFLHQCQITEIIPNKKLEYTWTYPDYSKGETLVTWLIEPQGENCNVRLMHENIENVLDGDADFSRANYIKGWTRILNQSLKNFVEK